MSGPAQRWIFVIGFLAACVAFWLGWRRLRRIERARTWREALRLAFYMSLALMVGCSSRTSAGNEGTTATTTTPARSGVEGTTTATATTTGTSPTPTPTAAMETGLGEEADEVWAELAGLWEEAGAYEPGVVTGQQLDAARERADGMLARLAGIGRVSSDAPGLVALLRIEFRARLDILPADVMCYEPMPARTPGAEAFERLERRVEALEELATKGYANPWLTEVVLGRLWEDLDVVERSIAGGDEWRTEDFQLRARDPAEVAAIVGRLRAALERLGGSS